ncbi:protein of unknown function [Algibacter lectus]|uniref:DUF3857 domain-containing protein n=1 Tax=Algibacter lectus TaxID=221126 RepID=UPI0008E51088|nr:DUF3857 domain-containing protein [Algibacter lectus]SFC37413.1 protein of unknown function [Algibacter lectus]
MKQITLILSLLSTLFISAQEEPYSSDTFTVSLEDVQTRTFAKDSSANALVIYEQGDSYVDKEEYDLHTKIKHKVKLLNTEGFEHANVAIYLYKSKNSKEKIENIKAITYNNVGGNLIKSHLLEKDIYTEDYNENTTLVKFTLPNIKEGSVITYSYEVISPFMFKYHGWDFQSDIPKLYSEYKASIPANWLYHTKLVGQEKLDVAESEIKKECLVMRNGATADCENSTFAMKDIPAFIEEDYMTTKSNYLARIEYELETFRGMDGSIKHYTKTWKSVDKELKSEKEIGKQIRRPVDLEDLLTADIINETDALKKTEAIYQYMQEQYTWNGDYKIFKDVSIKDLIETRSGNVSSINILLHNILREADIDVKPVLLSTRNNGFPTAIYPVISDFNYLIVQVTIGDDTYFLDATDKFLTFGEIPFRCLNERGRVIDFKAGSEWVDITPKYPTTTMYITELTLNNDATVSGTVKGKKTGYHALNAKKAYFPNNDNYINKLEDKHPNLEITNHEVLSESQISNGFSESYNVDLEFDNPDVNLLYLNPFIAKFFTTNPFKLQERSYPIDFGYADTYFYTLKLKFDPEVYEVSEAPKGVNLAIPNSKGSISYSSAVKENQVQLMFKIRFNDALYPPEYYPYLKEMMNKVVDIQTNSLILFKKK